LIFDFGLPILGGRRRGKADGDNGISRPGDSAHSRLFRSTLSRNSLDEVPATVFTNGATRITSCVMLRVGLLAMGGRVWIAGVHYLHSLLYGNSLLPTEQQGALHLYLDFGSHRLSDYNEMRTFSAGIHMTDFSQTRSSRIYRKLRKAAGVVVRQRRWPASLPMSYLSELLRKNHSDVLFTGGCIDTDIGIPQISWIPDFQHIHRPEFFSIEERQSREQHFARIMAEANRVIVSNQCSYADAARLYPETRHKLAVLPFTMYLGRNWRDADVRPVVLKYKLPRKFLFFPSQFWKHKNHLTLFRAVQLLRKRGIDAVLVCSGFPHDPRFPNYAAELREFLTTRNLEDAVRVLGLLPRHDQVQLMRASAAIVQPSLFEGWSALVEECRSLGKIIFASDIPMHREQLTRQMHLFAPTSAEALADLLGCHWQALTPGPDWDAEARAASQYHIRIGEFGRQFIALCGSVVEPMSAD
jgi:glycosyltransferase involved in cell wall biosynthesis